MQSAPSVVYPVGHSVFYRNLILAVGGVVGALLLMGWVGAWAAAPWSVRHGLWALGAALWAAWAARAWRDSAAAQAGALHWDARAMPAKLDGLPGAWFWRWPDPRKEPVPLRVVLVLDCQERMLVRTKGLPLVARWLWLERAACSARWDDLRRALTAHAEAA